MNRSIRLEGFVSRLLAKRPGIARIALTAVAGGAAPPVARWIEGSAQAEPVGSAYRSTRQIIGVLENIPNQQGRMLLEVLNGRPLYVRGRDEAVYIPMRIPAMPALNATMRRSVFRFNELSVLWTALHLAADGRRILISVAQQPEQTMGWYKDAFDLVSWRHLDARANTMSADDERLLDETRGACADYCGSNSYESVLLERGIASSHGQMPQRLRRLMTALIEKGICRITVATATLTEGVNLPFDIVFVTDLQRSSFDPITNRRILVPMTMGEFRNLAGRAGRAGAAHGMEGLTLVAIPQGPSSTAPREIPTQRRQVEQLKHDYELLKHQLIAEEAEQVEVGGPLAMLVRSIATRAVELFGFSQAQFMDWLERVTPSDISQEAGQAAATATGRLADSVDELDSLLLCAIEELDEFSKADVSVADAEAALVALWQRTFSAYAANQEQWLQDTFVRRGSAILQSIYPDPAERKVLYQYGYSPHIGRRFSRVAGEVRRAIQASAAYGAQSNADRLEVFVRLGELVVADRGYGFRVRATQTDAGLLESWHQVLTWWMQGPDARAPDPALLRAWQRFVSENLEFRLGAAVGAVVALAWSEGAENPLEVPSLAAWRATTGMPWFGFWARELLRWGTLDPFVAFALSQGLAKTRAEASEKRSEFEQWLNRNYEQLEPDDFIDPQLFLEWQRENARPIRPRAPERALAALLTGTDGRRQTYSVLPVQVGDRIEWLDPSGYKLATSQTNRTALQYPGIDHFELENAEGGWQVRRSFRAR
jgi:hypothetical protein